jgi:hypothetical protein
MKKWLERIEFLVEHTSGDSVSQPQSAGQQ